MKPFCINYIAASTRCIMKFYIIIPLIFFCGSVVRSYEYWENIHSPFILYKPWSVLDKPCVYIEDVTSVFRQVQHKFIIKLFIKFAGETKGHFIFSPLSMWKSLAAIAEGSVGTARQELFELLELPEDRCIRHQYYQLANSREISGNDVVLSRNQLFVIDESLLINRYWEHVVSSNGLTQIIRLPLKKKSEESLDTLRHISSAQLLNINLSGNSLLIDTLDHKVSWNTFFLGATIERVPFYNSLGEEINKVNMMKMKKRVKIAYLPDLKLKILELPVGYNSRYRLLLATFHESGTLKSIDAFKGDIFVNLVKNLRLSRIPIDIGIPEYSVTTEIDVRHFLENIGVRAVWNDSRATRNISDPPAYPSGFVQRVSLTISPPTRPSVQETSNLVPTIDDLKDEDTGLDVDVGREFILNKQFLLGLFEAETYVCIFASTFSEPGLNKE